MTRETFVRDMMKAYTFARRRQCPYYWEGYQRGLRRAYYGEAFWAPWRSITGGFPWPMTRWRSDAGSLAGAIARGWQFESHPRARTRPRALPGGGEIVDLGLDLLAIKSGASDSAME